MFQNNLHFFRSALVCAAILAGCSSQQAYQAGQEWQRNQCMRMPDYNEQQRCLDNINPSYDEYKRQLEK